MKISKKLLNSIRERVDEYHSGRLRIPSDIKKRVMNETLIFDEFKVYSFIQKVYNNRNNDYSEFIDTQKNTEEKK